MTYASHVMESCGACETQPQVPPSISCVSCSCVLSGRANDGPEVERTLRPRRRAASATTSGRRRRLRRRGLDVLNSVGHPSRAAGICAPLDDRLILLKIDAHVDDSFNRIECRRDLPSARIARPSNDVECCDLNGCGSVGLRCRFVHAQMTQAWTIHYTARFSRRQPPAGRAASRPR